MEHIKKFENFSDVDYTELIKDLVNSDPKVLDIKISGNVALIDGDVEGYIKYLTIKDGEISITYDIDIDDSGVPSEESMPIDFLLENDAKYLYNYLIKHK